jgi:hypothetical protein
MKRCIVIAVGVLLALAPAARSFAADGGLPDGAQACNTPAQEHNKHCESDGSQRPPDGGGGGDDQGGATPPPAPEAAADRLQAQAQDCASDARGDGDATPDCDTADDDHDGAPNQFDNCEHWNPGQVDADGDGRGESAECDHDYDDSDHDGVGDGWDADPGNHAVADAAMAAEAQVAAAYATGYTTASNAIDAAQGAVPAP